tara:strand:- start:97 stop:513 length:417 start_codon:yes stop_codon:yes gene_type:complete
METGFKARSFKFVYWIMLILLVGDTLDTIYSTVVEGYLGEGSAFPGSDVLFQTTTTDMIVFLVILIGLIYGIYLLYNLKKVGGYWVVGSNILFVIYASIFGPIAEVGFSSVLPIIAIYFTIYIILTIGVPWYYSEKFE